MFADITCCARHAAGDAADTCAGDASCATFCAILLRVAAHDAGRFFA